MLHAASILDPAEISWHKRHHTRPCKDRKDAAPARGCAHLLSVTGIEECEESFTLMPRPLQSEMIAVFRIGATLRRVLDSARSSA